MGEDGSRDLSKGGALGRTLSPLLLWLLVMLLDSARAQEFTPYGCVEDIVGPLTLASVAGAQDAGGLASPDVCADDCFKLGHSAFGIDGGTYCFCGEALNVTAAPSGTAVVTCDAVCLDNSECGGALLGTFSVGINDVAPSWFNVTLTGLTEPYVIKKNTAVAIVVGGTTAYSVDWGDGGISGGPGTSYKYTLPGTYNMEVYVTSAPSIRAVAKITVVDTPAFILDCPTQFALNVPGACNLTGLVQGFNFTYAYFVGTNFESITGAGTMPEASTSVYGSGVDLASPDTMTSTPTATNFVYSPSTGLVVQEGLITRVEATTTGASGAAVLDIMAMVPGCATGVFCVDGCGTACSATCSAQALCPSRGACQSSCPTTVSSGYTLVKLGTATVPATGGVAAFVPVVPPIAVTEGTYVGFVSTAGAVFVAQNVSVNGDVFVSTSATTSTTQSHLRHSVRFYVENHVAVSLLPQFTCTKPAAVPVANVPVPYDITTEQYANQSTVNISLTVTSPFGTVVTSLETAFCQVEILPPTLVPEMWMAYGSGAVLPITFTQGSSMVIFANIDATRYYSYFDDASLGYTWDLSLLYPTEGLYALVGEAFNALGRVNFTSLIHVVPNITDSWVLTAACPCVDWESGFTLTLNWPSAAHPPWNATITINGTALSPDGVSFNRVFIQSLVDDFATFDGTSLPGGATGAATALTWTDIFSAAAGNYTVTAYLSNEVSRTQTTVTFEVKEALRNVSAVIKWVQDGVELPGTGSSQDVYIVDKRVLVYPSSLTGDAEQWQLQILETGEIITGTQIPYETFYFNISFPIEGDYTLVVSGYNSVQGWVPSPPIPVTLVNKIAGFRLIDDFTLGKTNQVKTVQAMYDILTPISCLVVDWGDGSPIETYGYPERCNTTHADAKYMGLLSSNPMDLNHVYIAEGMYPVTGFAFDGYMNLQSELEVVVADIPCTMPVVGIVDAVDYTYQARKLFRMLTVTEEGTAEIECNTTVTVSRWWTVAKVNSTSGLATANINIKDILLTWNFSMLSIPAQYLDIGHYLLTYNVMIHMRFNLTRSANTYIEIIRSPISAILLVGSMSAVTRGFQQNLALNPGDLSQDPDALGVPFTNVTWHCRQLSPLAETFFMDSENYPLQENLQNIPLPLVAEQMSGGGCFGVGPGTVNMSLETSYLFQMSTFSETTGTFEIVAVVEKDVRRARASIQISISPLPQPIVQITCATPTLCWPLNDGQVVNPGLRLGLNGACIEECTDTLYYQWTVLDGNGNQLVVDDPNCTAVAAATDTLVLGVDGSTCEPSFMTSLDTSSLAITPTLYKLNPGIERYSIRLTIVTSDGRVGYSQITVQLNKPPIGGTCQMLYNESFAVLSRYEISCSDWKDPENLGIDNYLFHYFEQTTDGSTTMSTLASTKQSSISAILPVGVNDVYINVCDLLTACTTVSVGLAEAKMISKEQLDLYNTEALMQKYIESGDQVMLAMLLKAYNSVLRNANWTSLDSDSTANMTQQQIDDLMLLLSNVSAQQIEAIKNTASATSLSQINVYMESLSSALSGVMASEAASYTLDLATRDNVMAVLRKMTSNLATVDVASPKQLEPFLGSALSSMTAMMTSSNIILKNGDKAPPRDLLFAANMDYDTALKDDLDMVVPTDEKDLLTNNVLDNSEKKFKSQVNEMLSILQDVSTQVMKKMVKGEVTSAKTDTGASILIAKVGEEMLINGMTIDSPKDQNAKAVFPKRFCPSKQFNPYSICRTEFGITVVVWPCITHFYSATSNLLSFNSRILQAEVSLENKLVEVRNQVRPILFDIPRKPEELPEPKYANVTRDMNTNIPLVYHYFNVTIPMAAYTFEITLSEMNDRLILLIDHERYPIPSNNMDRYNISKLPLLNGTYSLFVNSKQNNNRTGKFVAGVGVLKVGATLENFTRNDLDKKFNSDYTFRVYVSGCYFFNETAMDWSGEENYVIEASHYLTTCSTPHLTGFGTGFLPTPNEVDFDFIIANMGFTDNSTLYIVLIILLVVYIIMMIWSHYKDKKDYERRGVIPFPDNKAEDKYIYEITFFTGPDSEAPCESNLSCMVSGDYGETPLRSLPKPTINLYRRYDRNSFVMTTPAPLGHLHYLRVCHDNSGRPPYDSWQLERVVIRDLQEHKLYSFETNAWLSFNRDDALTDKTFPCSENNDESSSFSQEMYNRTNKNANQDHMWMSMFLRPIGSRFSRKERVTVCAVFMYLSMLTNAMWYQSNEETGIDALIYIGPIPITTSLVLTGFFVLLVVYPVTLLIVFVFKRARPKNLKRCRALDAIERQKQEQYETKGVDESSAIEKARVQVDEEKSTRIRTKDKPVVLCIPWWTRYLAWIICLAAILVSIFLVWSYGIMWGNIRTVKWFASFFASFFISIILTQWIKVVLYALCSSVFTKTKLISEDIDCDEELPHLKPDEKWSHMKELDFSVVRDVHKLKGVDPNERDTKKLRKKLKNERDMKFVVRGVIMYCLFLVVLLIIVQDRTDTSNFLLKDHLVNLFITPGDPKLDFSATVATTDEFWSWMNAAVLQNLRAQKMYNGQQPLQLRGFLNDQANRIIGYAILRQSRTQRFNCKVVSPMNEAIKECTGTRGVTVEDGRDYCAGWLSKSTYPKSCFVEEFKYRNASQLQTFPRVGALGTYGAGGYVFRLKASDAELTEKMRFLQENHWIDRHSRFVSLEFSIYNANVNLFASCAIFVEINEGGGMLANWRFEPVKLLNQGTTIKDKLVILCEILFVIATVFFTITELWEMKNQKCEYFTSYWNQAELVILFLSYLNVGLFFYKAYLTKLAMVTFNETHGNAYVRMDAAIFVDQVYVCIMGVIMFVSIVKLIKILQFNKRMDVLALTIQKCWDELSIFFIAFGVIFFAFCCLFFFMFRTQLLEFSQLIGSVQTCFSMMLGKFDFQEMKEANELSPILFFVFSVLNSMILVNIMLSIILQAFSLIKKDLQKKANRYDVIDFMWASFKKFVVQQPNPVNQVIVETTNKKSSTGGEYTDEGSLELPDKVDQLMQYINVTYFGGKLDVKDTIAMKTAMAQSKKTTFPFTTDRKIIRRGEDD